MKIRATVPWTALQDTGEFISAEYLPPDFQFKDPSHIKNGDLVALYQHWRKRCCQYGIDQMFRFRSIQRSAGNLKDADYTCGLIEGVGDELHIERSSRNAPDAVDDNADTLDEDEDESSSEPEPPARSSRKRQRKASNQIGSQSDDDDHSDYFFPY